MRRDVEQIFDAYIKSVYYTRGADVMRFFTQHERKNICIDNICEQIQGVERSRMSISFNKKLYTKFIEDIAMKFCFDTLTYAKQQSLTRLEQSRLKADADMLAAHENNIANVEIKTFETKVV